MISLFLFSNSYLAISSRFQVYVALKSTASLLLPANALPYLLLCRPPDGEYGPPILYRWPSTPHDDYDLISCYAVLRTSTKVFLLLIFPAISVLTETSTVFSVNLSNYYGCYFDNIVFLGKAPSPDIYNPSFELMTFERLAPSMILRFLFLLAICDD